MVEIRARLRTPACDGSQPVRPRTRSAATTAIRYAMRLVRERIGQLSDHTGSFEGRDPESPLAAGAQDQGRPPAEPLGAERGEAHAVDVRVRDLDHGSHSGSGAIERERARPEPQRARMRRAGGLPPDDGPDGIARGYAGIVRARRSPRIRKRSHGAVSANPYPVSPRPRFALALTLCRPPPSPAAPPTVDDLGHGRHRDGAVGGGATDSSTRRVRQGARGRHLARQPRGHARNRRLVEVRPGSTNCFAFRAPPSYSTRSTRPGSRS